MPAKLWFTCVILCIYNAVITDDYIEPLSSLVVEPGDTLLCANISTVADLVYEEDEIFSVVISSEQERVIIIDNSSTVLILNDDSEYL